MKKKRMYKKLQKKKRKTPPRYIYIYIYTPLHRDPQHFSDPLNPKLHFFPFSFFFSPPLPVFHSVRPEADRSRNSIHGRARDHIAFIELEKFSVSSRCSFRSLGQNISIPPRIGDLPVELLLTTYRDSRRRVNGDTGTSWQDRCIPTVAL